MKEFLKKFLPNFVLSFYHFILAFLGALIYGFPSKKLTVIGVTGTKGKSTVVNFIGRILEEAGYRVGWVSSLSFKIGSREWLNPYHMTMPGRFLLQKTLKQMVKEKCHYAILEVTSEGILQHRHRFIDFKIAVFTGLAPEHIERHGSFENYRKAKGKLFKSAKKIHILNLDDENVQYFLKFQAKQKFGFTVQKDQFNFKVPNLNLVKAHNIRSSFRGIDFTIENIPFRLNLLGDFNVSNALAAVSLGLSQGISLEISRRALGKIEKIPGRMEKIEKGQNFTIIVDLAHTPDSFEAVFRTIKCLPHKRVISIFGAAGGLRDKWKRPVLGKIAAKYSDFIILCNEDPYDERPGAILDAIEKGIIEAGFKKENYLKIEDRRAAIRKGLEMAKENDVVLVLGKGTEQTMVIGNRTIPWDDRKVVQEEFENLYKQ